MSARTAGSSTGGATMVLLTAKASSRTSSAATLSSWARRDLGSLAGYPKIFALDLEPVGHLLEPPLRPLCKLFVIHLGFLLQRPSRVLLGEPSTLPRAPRCGSSAELWLGQQGVERSLGVVACVVSHDLNHLNGV